MNNAEMRGIWDQACKLIEKYIGKNSFGNWISKLEYISEEGENYLLAKSNFVRDVVASRYMNEIIKALQAIGENINSIDIRVRQAAENTDIPPREELDEPEDKSKRLQEENKDVVENVFFLDEKLTFDTFVVGKPNEFAYAAAMRVAESSDVRFNPLFLYGGVGLGKTHLMHAIAWNIKCKDPVRRVTYLSAEKFMYLFVKSLRLKNSMSFKEHFRNIDVLMIDDVQFISGKDATQEEFFHTFNDLVENNRQIIVSADKSPSDLNGMEERLKSRLGWGLVADIHPSTYELRLGILQSKVKNFAIKIPHKVIEFLAVKITSNIRELEGALNRIIAHSTLVGREVTIEMAQDVLRDLLRANERFITIEYIQKKVCEYYGVKFSDIISSKRNIVVARSRQIAMYLAKILTTKSLPEIGRNFGGKDHATVIYAVKKVKELIECDRNFASDVEVLQKSIEN